MRSKRRSRSCFDSRTVFGFPEQVQYEFAKREPHKLVEPHGATEKTLAKIQQKHFAPIENLLRNRGDLHKEAGKKELMLRLQAFLVSEGRAALVGDVLELHREVRALLAYLMPSKCVRQPFTADELEKSTDMVVSGTASACPPGSRTSSKSGLGANVRSLAISYFGNRP